MTFIILLRRLKKQHTMEILRLAVAQLTLATLPTVDALGSEILHPIHGDQKLPPKEPVAFHHSGLF